MRTRITVTDLSDAQWDRLQLRAKTEYEITPGTARVCIVFRTEPYTGTEPERHVEMPANEFALLLSELHLVAQAEAVLTPDALPEFLDELRATADPEYLRRAESDPIYSGGSYAYDQGGLTHEPLGDGTVRNDCAFCHRERTTKDDNHAPDCQYWSVGPGKLVADADLPEHVKAEMDADPVKYPDWKRP